MRAAKPPKLERRTAERHPCRLAAVCTPVPDGKPDCWPARLVDLSTGGISLLLDRPVEGNNDLLVKLKIGPATRTLTLRVLHVTELGPDTWLLGGAFTSQLTREDLLAMLGEDSSVRPAG